MPRCNTMCVDAPQCRVMWDAVKGVRRREGRSREVWWVSCSNVRCEATSGKVLQGEGVKWMWGEVGSGLFHGDVSCLGVRSQLDMK